MADKNSNDIAGLRAELDEILTWFESEEVTIEAAVAKYERALELAKKLEDALSEAKNTVEVIKQKIAK